MENIIHSFMDPHLIWKYLFCTNAFYAIVYGDTSHIA